VEDYQLLEKGSASWTSSRRVNLQRDEVLSCSGERERERESLFL
jgi:hypothetical protein